jgi:hypothetical protein
MAANDALSWLRSMDGQLYRNNPHPSGKNAWVAVVRATRGGGGAGTLIIALGSSMEEAAEAAAGRWQRLTAREQALH